mgnify:CR=1 FL=1
MKKGEQRKQELLKLAYRMFIEKGYENTSIDEIVAKAGIAKGTYYYYFASKEETLEAVIEMMIEKESAVAKELLQTPLSIPEKLVSVVNAFRPEKEEAVITDVLERKENIKISTLFSEKGEEYFRNLETKYLKELSEKNNYD